MSNRQPPKLATWLLSHFCRSSRDDSLVGDLHEQFAAGRSDRWFWRQALVALAQSMRRAVRLHALSFAGAITAGWLVMFAWFALNMSMTGAHTWAFRFVHDTVAITDGHRAWMALYFFAAATRVILFAIAGWLTVRIHRAYPYGVTIALIASAGLVRWVPWRTYAAFNIYTLVLIHDVTAIGGLLLGAAWAIHQQKPKRFASSV